MNENPLDMTPTQIWGLGILIVFSVALWTVLANKDIHQPIMPNQMTKWDYLSKLVPYAIVAVAIVLICDPWQH